MKCFRFFWLLLCILSLPAYSQISNGGIIVFDNAQDNPYIRRKPSKAIYSNQIKIGLLSPFRGIYEVGYERMLKHGFSLEASMGYTYRDYLFERLSTSGLYNSPNFSVKGGVAARLGMKYYPFSEGWFSGLYFTPEFAYRQYNFNARVTNINSEGDNIPVNMHCMYDFTEARLGVGQSVTDNSGRLFVDYRLGLAFRQVTGTFPEFINTGSEVYYQRSLTTRFGPAFVMNIFIGYAF